MQKLEDAVSTGKLVRVDIELDGKRRAVGVTREAIENYLRVWPEKADRLTIEEQKHFVQSHLPLITATVKRKLSAGYYDADVVVIKAGELS